ncbi:hypothetical protein RYX36_033407, partial [Vicia faba]
ENQSKHSRYAARSSSHSRQSVEVEHVDFDNTLFTGHVQQAQFYILVERQIWPDKIFTLNPQGDYRCDMNTKAQLYVTPLLYNIKPRSHTSTIPIDTYYLLYYMIKGWKIDVAQVIPNEIKRILISGHSHGNKAPMTLGFSALITGLCRKVGVDIPNMATKRIISIVNEDYSLQHCMPKLAGEAAPQPQAHAPLAGP